MAFGLTTVLGISLALPLFATLQRGGDMMKAEMAPMLEESRDVMAPKLSMGPPPASPEPGGFGSGKLIGSASAPRVRSWFPETMLWVPEVTADKDGFADITFEVPDSITTWRLNAWANTSDGQFGEGQMSMLVSQRFFIELDLPTNLTDGDRITIPVSFVNKGESEVSLPLRTESSGALQAGTLPPTVTIPAGGRVLKWLEVRGNGIGTGSIQVSAGDAETGDAVRRSAEVAPDGRTLRDTHSGMIDDGWIQSVQIPQSLPGSSDLTIEVYPSAVADALDGLQSMLRAPNGCFEQTSSTNFPNVMVLRTLKSVEPTKWPKWQDLSPEQSWQKAHTDATRFIQLGYQKILTFQKSDGGFALYPERFESDLMLTAYGIIQLKEMQTVTTVDPQVISRAANWLANQQSEDGTWPTYAEKVGGGNQHGLDIGQVRGVSFITLALIAANTNHEFDNHIERALNHVETRLSAAEEPDAIALAANALAAADRKEVATKAVDRLLSSVTQEKDLAFWSPSQPTWMGGGGRYANIETTALAAYAMLETGAGAETLPRVLNYLASSRSHGGGWGTTQATVWTLRTLERLRSKQNPAALQIYLDGTLIPRADGKAPVGMLQIDATPQPVTAFRTTEVQPGSSLVTIVSDAPTAAMSKAVLQYAVPWTSPLAADNSGPLKIEVDAPTNLKAASPSRTSVHITNQSEDVLRTLIVELPLPPGAFAPPEQFASWQESGLIDEFEIMPTHVRLYISALARKKRIGFTYEFLPFLGGSMSLPPARAYRFYVPEPVAEADGGDIRVVR